MKELFLILLSGVLLAQPARELRDRDTSVVLFDAGGGQFGVGVQSSVKASHALVQVFYEERAATLTLLLHKESIAPVVAEDGYGATNENFNIPREKIKFIRVKLLQEVAAREIRYE
ncbi:MAG: hypothetical protein EPO02_08745 [Nitrospirae bacterium]|nr:MAG: hypothetical protein EPO02_08745 [Nitrospirota bacterium]